MSIKIICLNDETMEMLISTAFSVEKAAVFPKGIKNRCEIHLSEIQKNNGENRLKKRIFEHFEIEAKKTFELGKPIFGTLEGYSSNEKVFKATVSNTNETTARIHLAKLQSKRVFVFNFEFAADDMTDEEFEESGIREILNEGK